MSIVHLFFIFRCYCLVSGIYILLVYFYFRSVYLLFLWFLFVIFPVDSIPIVICRLFRACSGFDFPSSLISLEPMDVLLQGVFPPSLLSLFKFTVFLILCLHRSSPGDRFWLLFYVILIWIICSWCDVVRLIMGWSLLICSWFNFRWIWLDAMHPSIRVSIFVVITNFHFWVRWWRELFLMLLIYLLRDLFYLLLGLVWLYGICWVLPV